MRDLAIFLVVFSSIPYILNRPQIGIYLWSWISYMNPHRLSYGFAYNFPFALVVGIATLASFVLYKGDKKLPINYVTILFILLVFWTTISTVFAINFDSSLYEWKRTIKIFIMSFITMMVIKNRKDLNLYVISIVVSLGFYGAKGGIFVLATGGSYRVWGPPKSFVEDNNTLALALLMIVPLARYLYLRANRKWLKYLILAFIVSTSFSIISSYSRGAMLAGFTIMIFLLFKSKKKVMMSIVLGIIASALVMFMPDQWMDRMNTLENVEEDSSAMGRINAWWYAFYLALDRPLTGGGFRSFTKDLFYIYAPDPLDFHDAHSIYFEMLGEQGFVGLALFLLLFIFSYKMAGDIIRRTRNDPQTKWAADLAAMVQISFIAYAVGGAFLGLAYYDLPYSLVSIVVILNHVTKDISGDTDKKIMRSKNV